MRHDLFEAAHAAKHYIGTHIKPGMRVRVGFQGGLCSDQWEREGIVAEVSIRENHIVFQPDPATDGELCWHDVDGTFHEPEYQYFLTMCDFVEILPPPQEQ